MPFAARRIFRNADPRGTRELLNVIEHSKITHEKRVYSRFFAVDKKTCGSTLELYTFSQFVSIKHFVLGESSQW